MRYRLVVIAIVAAAALVASASAMTTMPGDGRETGSGGSPSAPGSAVFVLTGSGYGHGVGLSQYGAQAQGQAGRSFADILGFYYPGTALEPSPMTTMRVLFAPAAMTLTVSSAPPFSVRDATGSAFSLPSGIICPGPV